MATEGEEIAVVSWKSGSDRDGYFFLEGLRLAVLV